MPQFEDQPGWDWRTMGNRLGPGGLTAAQYDALPSSVQAQLMNAHSYAEARSILQAGQIIKAASDRAQRSIKVPTIQPVTVLRVAVAAGIAGGVATVHVDGDPVDETRDVTISSTYIPQIGDRAQLQYTPPFGASIVAPLGVLSGSPAGSINSRCGSIVAGGTIAGFDVGPATYCCEEFVTGGMQSDNGTTLIVPKSGVYGVRFEASFFFDEQADEAIINADMYRASDGYLVSSWVGHTPPNSSGTGVWTTIDLGRDAVPLNVQDELVVIVGNGTFEELILTQTRLDISWRADHDGSVNDCHSGGE